MQENKSSRHNSVTAAVSNGQTTLQALTEVEKQATFLSRVPVHCIKPFCSDALVSPPNLYPPCWVPEVFLACGGNFRCWPKADTSSAVARSHERRSHYKDLTETGNRARKVSDTQGIRPEIFRKKWTTVPKYSSFSITTDWNRHSCSFCTILFRQADGACNFSRHFHCLPVSVVHVQSHLIFSFKMASAHARPMQERWDDLNVILLVSCGKNKSKNLVMAHQTRKTFSKKLLW